MFLDPFSQMQILAGLRKANYSSVHGSWLLNILISRKDLPSAQYTLRTSQTTVKAFGMAPGAHVNTGCIVLPLELGAVLGKCRESAGPRQQGETLKAGGPASCSPEVVWGLI